MKRLPFRKVIDNLAGSSGSSSSKKEAEINESLSTDDFTACKVVRHGFPFEPTALAYDPVQNILAIGSKNGSLRIFGRPGVDCHVRHEADTAVMQLMFLVNEGGIVSVCADDSLHLWNLRQKRPAILHSLKFNRERITFCHLPFQSKWLYIGTERGNVHIVHIESFNLSGYVINWNKAIELSMKKHPGPVVHLSDNPADPNKLLIGFENGVLALWDLVNKVADYRYNCNQPVHSIAWHYEGKQFVCSHSDGTLTIWNMRSPANPANIISPHAKVPAKGVKPEPCTPVLKVQWKSVKSGDPFILFSGGLPIEKASQTPSITIMQGKTTTVLEMEHPVVDFLTLCENPWPSNPEEPYAVVVLLESDLVVVDLASDGYPCFENPYPMDLHESPVTCIQYYADCPSELITEFYSAGASILNRKKQAYSQKNWPIKGGRWGACGSSNTEVIITGHADGSIKFWDASQVMLQVLYKVKTAKIFEKSKQAKSLNGDDEPFAIQLITMCKESKVLAVVGASSHIILFRFSKIEVSTELSILEISIVYTSEDPDTPEGEAPPLSAPAALKRNASSISTCSISSIPATSNQTLPEEPPSPGASEPNPTMDGCRNNIPNLRVKTGFHKRAVGYQPDLCCQLLWVDDEAPPVVTGVAVNTAYGLLAIGTTNGLAIVDFMQKSCLLNMGTPDLYGSADPYQRTPRSPRKNKMADIVEQLVNDSIHPQGEQNGGPTSPTNVQQRRTKNNHHDPGRLQRSKSQGVRKVVKTASTTSESGNVDEQDEDPTLKRHSSALDMILTRSSSVFPSNFLGSAKSNRSESSFTRSRSSSMSSLEKESREGVQSVAFAESYTRKEEAVTCPCLWVGTTLGSVLGIVVNLPPPGEQRLSQPVIVSPSGTIFRLKGTVVLLAFLDCVGILVPPAYEPWKDHNKEERDTKDKRMATLQTRTSRMSPSSSTEIADRQFIVISSEKEIKVISLPSQTCTYKSKICDTSYLVRADVFNLHNSVCLACYVANGHIMAFSLPSLRLLLDEEYLPLTDLRIGRTFQMSAKGKGVYQCSPTEIQRLTVCSETSENLHDMLGDLFLPVETPEAPSRGFFKGLFGSGSSSLDREELFGENSGKASKSVAKHIPGQIGIDSLRAASGGAMSEVAKARIALQERGEKVSELEQQTAAMMEHAENFAQASHQLMNKYKDKKWYQF
ncbi:syntaxin-binding protein 5-like isoform X3 [Apostichopus japonicus]|uniref:syntaxin-binding protein 5-like isoform X3 n=1 Tax=Stichopus japonicus TaxID=307972 RepID=UPI003AB8FD73